MIGTELFNTKEHEGHEEHEEKTLNKPELALSNCNNEVPYRSSDFQSSPS
jgi:hypothetical protein